MVLFQLPAPSFEKNQVGSVNVSITVTNNIDQVLAERGFIANDEVRTVTLDNVLVDTGATLLSLPTAIIEQLGLPVRGEAIVNTSAGKCKARIFKAADLIVNGRQSTFDCLELTDIDQPLLGVIPMERLGLEPDLQNRTLRTLPIEENNTYLYS
ncbi:MAG: aspartyl protease family protein [Phormidesmis sp.]